jgi:hypothetical protein
MPGGPVEICLTLRLVPVAAAPAAVVGGAAATSAVAMPIAGRTNGGVRVRMGVK